MTKSQSTQNNSRNYDEHSGNPGTAQISHNLPTVTSGKDNEHFATEDGHMHAKQGISMLATEKMFMPSVSNNADLDESNSDMKSNSLHEYAHLAGYLQTRVVPGVAAKADGPDEE